LERFMLRCFGVVVFLASIFTFSSLALAHDESAGGAGFVAGMFHPVLGFDHFLAMLSVGVISAQIGGRAIWYIPGAFVLAMILGGVLGMQSISVFAVEVGIALSVLILGAILAAGKVMPGWIAIIAVAHSSRRPRNFRRRPGPEGV
jgi:urease accessory protein